jgi:hypothetical protein
MRIAGIFLLGLGIVSTALCAIGLLGSILGGGNETVVGALIALGIMALGVLLIVSGLALVRRAESKQPDGSPATAFGMQFTDQATGGDPVTGTLQKIQRFRLDRLNWIGWLVLFATMAVALGGAFASMLLIKWIPADGKRPPIFLVGFPLLLLSAGFFVLLRRVLDSCGVSIYRH